MTVNEIKDSIDKGLKVYWSNFSYPVIKDNKGQYLITCTSTNYCIGLTHMDDISLNGKETDFFTS